MARRGLSNSPSNSSVVVLTNNAPTSSVHTLPALRYQSASLTPSQLPCSSKGCCVEVASTSCVVVYCSNSIYSLYSSSHNSCGTSLWERASGAGGAANGGYLGMGGPLGGESTTKPFFLSRNLSSAASCRSAVAAFSTACKLDFLAMRMDLDNALEHCMPVPVHVGPDLMWPVCDPTPSEMDCGHAHAKTPHPPRQVCCGRENRQRSNQQRVNSLHLTHGMLCEVFFLRGLLPLTCCAHLWSVAQGRTIPYQGAAQSDPPTTAATPNTQL